MHRSIRESEQRILAFVNKRLDDMNRRLDDMNKRLDDFKDFVLARIENPPRRTASRNPVPASEA